MKRIDRAKIEQHADDLRYRFAQLRHHPEQVRKLVMIGVAALAIVVTGIVWLVRVWPEAEAPEAQAFRRAHRSLEEWVEDASHQLARDARFERVALTYSDKGIIVMGQVGSNGDLAELRQVLLRSEPPRAIEWQVTTGGGGG